MGDLGFVLEGVSLFLLLAKKEQRGCTAEHFFPVKRLKKSNEAAQQSTFDTT